MRGANAMRIPVCVLIVMLLAGAGNSNAETVDINVFCPKALVATGNTARIQQVLARAQRGEKITIAVIGGSITAGAKASVPLKNYGNRIAAWWRQKFPKAEIKFVNAGIGATGSNYGALRAQRDLLAHRPDFVVVEYSVNDRNVQPSAETLEGLVRQILKQPNQPAVLLLFMMNKSGSNAQEWHSRVGVHYGLPMISFRDALWPAIKDGSLKWETLEADEVHPNDLGHECAARFVTSFLESLLPAQAVVTPLPAPLFSDLYEHVTLQEAADLKPVKNEGWVLDSKTGSWRSDKPGSVIEFETKGQVLYSMHYVVKKAMGKARIQVDDGQPVVQDGWFNQTWGGYRSTSLLAKDLKPGLHRVRIELLSEKNPGSEGHEFRFLGLGSAGTGSN